MELAQAHPNYNYQYFNETEHFNVFSFADHPLGEHEQDPMQQKIKVHNCLYTLCAIIFQNDVQTAMKYSILTLANPTTSNDEH